MFLKLLMEGTQIIVLIMLFPKLLSFNISKGCRDSSLEFVWSNIWNRSIEQQQLTHKFSFLTLFITKASRLSIIKVILKCALDTLFPNLISRKKNFDQTSLNVQRYTIGLLEILFILFMNKFIVSLSKLIY